MFWECDGLMCAKRMEHIVPGWQPRRSMPLGLQNSARLRLRSSRSSNFFAERPKTRGRPSCMRTSCGRTFSPMREPRDLHAFARRG